MIGSARVARRSALAVTVLAAVPLAVGGAARAASAWTEASSLHSAVWSPDGSRIAFVHAIERQPDRATSALYLVRADRSSRRRLAVLDGRIHGLTWSQRGDRLAFVGGNPDRASVRVVRPDGWLIAEIVGASDFDWAPDGRRLVVWRSSPGAEQRSEVLVVDATGKRWRSVAEGFAPDWSSSGNWIAFAARAPGRCESRIYVARSDGSAVRRISPDVRNGDVVGLHYSPVWSPDGRRIAFLEGAVCGAAISKVAPDTYVVDVTTGRTAAVGRGDPVWSPTGAHIAVNADGNVEIWRSRGRRRAVFERATGAVWSPDGDRIAFSSIACWSADCYRSSIEIAARDGRGRRRLAAGLSPAWAPDGKRVAFVGPPSSTATPWAFRGLYTAAAASGRVRRLFVAPPSS